MRAGVEKLSREMGQPKWYQILEALVEAMKPYARHGVNVNVDFYAGVVYFLNGIGEDLFVPVFAVGRVPGWTVQVMEQLANNILIRPLTLYDGPPRRDYVDRRAARRAAGDTTAVVATMSSTLAPREVAHRVANPGYRPDGGAA
jgi:citrate synthase